MTGLKPALSLLIPQVHEFAISAYFFVRLVDFICIFYCVQYDSCLLSRLSLSRKHLHTLSLSFFLKYLHPKTLTPILANTLNAQINKQNEVFTFFLEYLIPI